MDKRRWRWALIGTLLLLAAYVGSYLYLSRRGYADAEAYGMRGFYYFYPENSKTWEKKNYSCVLLFAPLNAIDRALGFGRAPAAAPLAGLSKAPADPPAVP